MCHNQGQKRPKLQRALGGLKVREIYVVLKLTKSFLLIL